MEGIIFDIQPFALHDGPGIRTTVFLKGCPLRCRWCSNPESFTMQTVLSHKIDRCVNCLQCVQVCEDGSLINKEGKLAVYTDRCTACGRCIEVCPENALKLYGYKESTGNILKRVLKDKAYFDKSGGGITLSGGEPMLQAEFALHLLMESKIAGLHTCIETSGYADQEEIKRILPHVDLFLFDYKATGSDQHLSLTKQGNDQILSNLYYLNNKGAQIVLRCPLIPGLNDTGEHLSAIAQLGEELENVVEVELLPYHNFGEHKYEQLGLKKPETNMHAVSDSLLQSWIGELEVLGCNKVKQINA